MINGCSNFRKFSLFYALSLGSQWQSRDMLQLDRDCCNAFKAESIITDLWYKIGTSSFDDVSFLKEE